MTELIECASNLFPRAMLMTLYSTGVRRAELCQLKVEDIDGNRMIIHIRQGKTAKTAMCRSIPSFEKRSGNTTGG